MNARIELLTRGRSVASLLGITFDELLERVTALERAGYSASSALDRLVLDWPD